MTCRTDMVGESGLTILADFSYDDYSDVLNVQLIELVNLLPTGSNLDSFQKNWQMEYLGYI